MQMKCGHHLTLADTKHKIRDRKAFQSNTNHTLSCIVMGGAWTGEIPK